jgi:serine/threonine-protein kinase/endoribonuclease IRE1
MKSDMWMEIDPHSGKKLHTISSEGSMSSCPATETYTRSFFIARTAYTLRVYDSVTKEKRWDATYLEYNSYSSTPTINRDHLYFSSTTDDMLISIDPNTGHEVWRGSYNSPVMAVFALEEGQLRKVPFYSVAVDGIDSIGLAALSMYAKTDELKTAETNVR